MGGEAGWRRGSTRTSSVITSVATSAHPSGSRLVDEALFKRGKGMAAKIILRNKQTYFTDEPAGGGSSYTGRKGSGRPHLFTHFYIRGRFLEPWSRDTQVHTITHTHTHTHQRTPTFTNLQQTPACREWARKSLETTKRAMIVLVGLRSCQWTAKKAAMMSLPSSTCPWKSDGKDSKQVPPYAVIWT